MRHGTLAHVGSLGGTLAFKCRAKRVEGRRQRTSPVVHMKFLRRIIGWKPQKRHVTNVRKVRESLVSARQELWPAVHFPKVAQQVAGRKQTAKETRLMNSEW